MRPSDILTLAPIEPDWIVQSVLPRHTMVILAGEAGAGKSTLCYCLAYAVALGLPFLGLPTTPTRVLYFDQENGWPDFLQYNQWAWAGVGCPDPSTLDLWIQLEHLALLGDWKETMAQKIQAFRPGLVILDTATEALHLRDENDNAEAARAIHHLRRLQALGDRTTFLVLKHEKQRDEPGHRRTIRGAKVWLGAFDQVLYHVIPAGAKRRKDGTRITLLEPGKPRAFALRHPIRIDPVFTDTLPTGLTLHGTPLPPPSLLPPPTPL